MHLYTGSIQVLDHLSKVSQEKLTSDQNCSWNREEKITFICEPKQERSSSKQREARCQAADAAFEFIICKWERCCGNNF